MILFCLFQQNANYIEICLTCLYLFVSILLVPLFVLSSPPSLPVIFEKRLLVVDPDPGEMGFRGDGVKVFRFKLDVTLDVDDDDKLKSTELKGIAFVGVVRTNGNSGFISKVLCKF